VPVLREGAQHGTKLPCCPARSEHGVYSPRRGDSQRCGGRSRESSRS
jgi:hypothetical protein